MFLHNHASGEESSEGVQKHNRPAGSSAGASEGSGLSELLDQRICPTSEGDGQESWESSEKEPWVARDNPGQLIPCGIDNKR